MDQQFGQESVAGRGDGSLGEHTEELKIFVGGISWHSTQESLQRYFMQFGPVTEVILKKHEGGKARGFGFITFESRAGIDAVFAEDKVHNHVIDNRQVEVKRAMTQERQRAMKLRTKRLWVAVRPNVEKNAIKDYFQQFGEVEDVIIKMDRATNRRKGFVFIIFKSEDSVEDVLKLPSHSIEGREIIVKRAENEDPGARMKGYSYPGVPTIQGVPLSRGVPRNPVAGFGSYGRGSGRGASRGTRGGGSRGARGSAGRGASQPRGYGGGGSNRGNRASAYGDGGGGGGSYGNTANGYQEVGYGGSAQGYGDGYGSAVNGYESNNFGNNNTGEYKDSYDNTGTGAYAGGSYGNGGGGYSSGYDSSAVGYGQSSYGNKSAEYEQGYGGAGGGYEQSYGGQTGTGGGGTYATQGAESHAGPMRGSRSSRGAAASVHPYRRP